MGLGVEKPPPPRPPPPPSGPPPPPPAPDSGAGAVWQAFIHVRHSTQQALQRARVVCTTDQAPTSQCNLHTHHLHGSLINHPDPMQVQDLAILSSLH